VINVLQVLTIQFVLQSFLETAAIAKWASQFVSTMLAMSKITCHDHRQQMKNYDNTLQFILISVQFM